MTHGGSGALATSTTTTTVATISTSASGNHCKSPSMLHPHSAGGGLSPSGTNTLISTRSTASGKPKSSPRSASKLFAGLLRSSEARSRSNSTALSIRRFSTDSIFGERMDTIGRRLSRDISYSPPDLGSHRFETFGKSATTLQLPQPMYGSSSAVIAAGGSKSSENITGTTGGSAAVAAATTNHRFDGHHTLSSAMVASMPLTDLPAKARKTRNNHRQRPALNFEPYQRNAANAGEAETSFRADDATMPSRATTARSGKCNSSATAPAADGHDSSCCSSYETLPAALRDALEPPIYRLDRSKATQRARLHRELRDKYGQAPLAGASSGAAIDDRPPVMPAAYRSNAERLARHHLCEAPVAQQQHQQQLQQPLSSSAAATRPPVPSPRNSQRDADGGGSSSSGNGATDSTVTLPAAPTSSAPSAAAAQTSQRAAAQAHMQATQNAVPPPRPPKMNFERLSREDLLRLSHSSQSEIHEYLNGSSSPQQSKSAAKHQQQHQPEPP